MRRCVFVLCALLLAGCDGIGDLTSDAYDPGDATQSRFTVDSEDCQAGANTVRNYNIYGVTGTHAERHEIFNRAYARCMQKAGYARRDWSPEIADPYAIDPLP